MRPPVTINLRRADMQSAPRIIGCPNTKTGGLGQALLLENCSIQVRYAEAARSWANNALS